MIPEIAKLVNLQFRINLHLNIIVSKEINDFEFYLDLFNLVDFFSELGKGTLYTEIFHDLKESLQVLHYILNMSAHGFILHII